MNSIDFSLCEREHIHIPGYIQPHGYVISCHHDTLMITSISSNFSSPFELLSSSVKNWIDPDIIDQSIVWFHKRSQQSCIYYEVSLPKLGIDLCDMYLYASQEEMIFEIIPKFIEKEEPFFEHLEFTHSVEQIVIQGSLITMCEQASKEVRLLSGFDRVMIYRFDEEYNGCVIAEDKDEHLFPYLGLNYPASDIPLQARELYRKNLIRCIIDTDYKPVSIMRDGFRLAPLDMTYSYLRSVSPVHIEYLRNMGVQATMTVSIIVNQQLWGLIACHHHTPLQHSLKRVAVIESLGKVFSSILTTRLNNDLQLKESELHFKLDTIIQNIQTENPHSPLFTLLAQHHKMFHSFFQADHFSLLFEGEFISLSPEYPQNEVVTLIDTLKPLIVNGAFSTANLAGLFPDLDPNFLEKYAGIFLIEIKTSQPNYWIWSRKEKKQTVMWGGNPNEKGYINEQGGISPRKSFEAFQQIVQYKSEPWNQAEILFIQPFRNTINHLIEWYDSQIKVAAQQKTLSYMEEEKSRHYKQLLESLVDLIEQRDAYTAGHTRRVAIYCDLIAKQLELSIQERNTLYEAAILHDIGKVVVPDAILLKPGKLDRDEYELIKNHLNTGYSILNKIDYYRPLAQIIRHHHEKYDGSGYPQGLMGDDIPLASHIMIVADAIDAMTSNRIYQPRRTMKEACDEILRYKGVWYHPNVVDAALRAFHSASGDDYATQIPITSTERARFAYFFKDQLTGVYNENYLTMILRGEIPDLAYRCFILIEIKGMTLYNSQYGWHQGDKIIQKISDFIAEHCSKEDIFRVFGDDFIVGFSSFQEAERTVRSLQFFYSDITGEAKILTPEALQSLL